MIDILDTIDGALAGQISFDAMRWHPDPEHAPPIYANIEPGDTRHAVIYFAVHYETFGHAIRRFVRALTRALVAIARNRVRLEKLRLRGPGTPYARRSAMRAAYRAKTRRRPR